MSRRLHSSRRTGLLGDIDRMQAGRLPDADGAPPERDERGRLILLDPGFGRPFVGEAPDHRLTCLECGETDDCGCGGCTMNGGPISGDDGEALWAGQAHETCRRELAAALGDPGLSWGQAIARVEQRTQADRAARTPAPPVRQCSATSGGDRCARAAGHEGKHWCADPQFSWGIGPLHLSDVVGGGL